jgi:hypothetical protein
MTEAEKILEAREVLGDGVRNMTDAEVYDLVVVFEGLADVLIDEYVEQHRRARPRPVLNRAA